MPLTIEKKTEICQEHRRHDSDTGSAEIQIALLTERILQLTEHLKTHKKDHASRRGLLMMVGHRAGLLKFLAATAPARYQALIRRLGLRR